MYIYAYFRLFVYLQLRGQFTINCVFKCILSRLLIVLVYFISLIHADILMFTFKSTM